MPEINLPVQDNQNLTDLILKNPKILAEKIFLLEKGELKDFEFENIIYNLAPTMNLVALFFIKETAASGFKGISTKTIFDIIENASGKYQTGEFLEIRRELIRQISEIPRFYELFDQKRFNLVIELFGKNSDYAQDFKRKMIQRRPDLAAKFETGPLGSKPNQNPVNILIGMILTILKDPLNISNLPLITWKDPDFQQALSYIFKNEKDGKKLKIELENSLLTSNKEENSDKLFILENII